MENDKTENIRQETSPPTVTLPKGGGAIRGIGEKFAANPVTGTGSMNVPIAISPGRSGFGPQLNLTYDSGSGNGPYGFGWSLSLPSITRKTDKGLPRYLDAEQSDVFMLSGAQDLVPVLIDMEGEWEFEKLPPRIVDSETYHVQRYRPRIEGLFARIERWTNSRGDVHWRSISKDNILTLYGKDNNSRIFDPHHPEHIFSWLICETRDDKGNAILYEYKEENGTSVDIGNAHEYNRDSVGRDANRYLKFIRYGNRNSLLNDSHHRPPFLSNTQLSSARWMFEVVLDYGEHDPDSPSPNDEGEWLCRHDPFSSYRSGFEIRTYRLCQRVLMFHHFLEDPEVGQDCLIRSTDFVYRNIRDNPDDLKHGHPVATFIASLTQTAYKRRPGEGYRRKSLPPLEFEYSQVPRPEQFAQLPVQEVDAESLENLPIGLDGASYQWIDLDGEGTSGLITEQGNSWYYKRNLSANNQLIEAENERTVVRFGPVELIASTPAGGLSGGVQFLDLAGDGQVDLTQMRGPIQGFYERTSDANWEPFKTFSSPASVNTNDPDLRFVDLTGDGHADILITEGEALSWHPSLAEEGFGPGIRVSLPWEEERGPRVIFSDSTQSIYLADCSGDGLSDLVRIRNGEICYWPNLGYGRFGAKITMDNPPCFDAPDQFDQKRIRLVDTDGSGTTDLLYLHRDGVRIYFNQSGNSWSESVPLPQFPRIDSLTSIQTLDLLGNGTGCLVWSSSLPGDSHFSMRYIALFEEKPHLLIGVRNNLGAETRVHYAPSTKFYLNDKQNGQPWISRLPFPVHCVEKVSVHDRWRGTTFTTTYSYHHGYFDGPEREFRGFGRVDQVDVEDYGVFTAGSAGSPYITDDQTLYQPPIKTISWYHTGAMLDRERILSQFSAEYFPKSFEDLDPNTRNVLGEFEENILPEPDLVSEGLDTDEWQEALRACKGMLLRQEIYELDVDALEVGVHKPVKFFSAAYHNCHIRRLQGRGINRHAIFLVTESEAISYHYELDLRAETLTPDPRIAHTLNLNVDEYGNVLQSVAVVYPRLGRHIDSTFPSGTEDKIAQVQKEMHLAYSETRYTNDMLEADDYRLRVPCEVKTYELTGIRTRDEGDVASVDVRDDRYFSLDELRAYRLSEVYQAEGIPVSAIEYHLLPNHTSPQKRVVEHARTLFFAHDLIRYLPFGELNALGLTYETYKLALTGSLLESVFDADQLTDEVLAGLSDSEVSGYLSGTELTERFPDAGGQYWMRSGRAGFQSDAARHFYLPERYTDPFGKETVLAFDPLDLYIESSRDPLGNTTRVERFDYRVLAPAQMKDINDNLSEVVFDILGMPVAMAVKGKGEEGDNLDGFDDAVLNPDLETLTRFFTGEYNEAEARRFLGNATARFLYSFGETVAVDGLVAYGEHPACACGILREQHVAQLGAGETSPLQVGFEYSDGTGIVLVKKAQAEPEMDGGPMRWLSSGKTILNNKGKPVKQFEPYFSPNAHRFEELLEVGVAPVMYYDAPGRLIRTEMPDGSYSRVEFSPWQVTSYDANDTVREDGNLWYARRTTPDASEEHQRAARLASVHADTPPSIFLDSLGREVIAVEHNKWLDSAGVSHEEKYITFTRLDAEGKPLWIRDARGNLVMQYIHPPMPDEQRIDSDSGFVPCYDIAGNLLFQHSMDAGDRWMINDAAGKPMYAWDQNERIGETGERTLERRFFHTVYEELHRPLEQRYRVDTGEWQVIERFVYGESIPEFVPSSRNLRGQVYRHYDPGGLVTCVSFDFKGNLLEVRRRLVDDYRAHVIDWSVSTTGLGEEFTRITEYDALNRMTRTYNWHRGLSTRVAIYEPRYSQRGLLEGEEIVIGAMKTESSYEMTGPGPDRRPAQRTNAVVRIAYNAKGQQEHIEYGNGSITKYTYDPETFRLVRLSTTRLSDAAVLQNLQYTYDPVGNLTAIRDDAQQTVFFSNSRVDPRCHYQYDSLYRLIHAQGREHAAQNNFQRDGRDFEAITQIPFPNSPEALQNYTEEYIYDSVGNILRMRHIGGDEHRWTRRYQYEEFNNRLSATNLPGDADGVFSARYAYDTHGSVLNLSNVAEADHIRWDYRDMIQYFPLGTEGHAFYNYDASKQRTRKIILEGDGMRRERLYLGGLEIYRHYSKTDAPPDEIETHHLFIGEQRVLLVEDVLPTGTLAGIRLFRYKLGNHLGSTSLELDEDAAVITYEEYHPYGTTAYQSGRSEVEVKRKRYRYTGMERDDETGLNYHRARYYSIWLGKWCSADPIGITAGCNIYCYCQNNPLQSTDRFGRQAENEIPPSTTMNRNRPQSLRPESTTVLQDIRNMLAAIRIRLETAKELFGGASATIEGTNDMTQTGDPSPEIEPLEDPTNNVAREARRGIEQSSEISDNQRVIIGPPQPPERSAPSSGVENRPTIRALPEQLGENLQMPLRNGERLTVNPETGTILGEVDPTLRLPNRIVTRDAAGVEHMVPEDPPPLGGSHEVRRGGTAQIGDRLTSSADSSVHGIPELPTPRAVRARAANGLGVTIGLVSSLPTDRSGGDLRDVLGIPRTRQEFLETLATTADLSRPGGAFKVIWRMVVELFRRPRQ